MRRYITLEAGSGNWDFDWFEVVSAVVDEDAPPEGPIEEPVEEPINQAPTTPSNLTASAINATQVELYWEGGKLMMSK